MTALALAAPPAYAQDAEALAQHPGERYRVSLLTMGPGDAIWELFGHNAIRVRDLETGLDVAYNWGMFDFNAVDFWPRLVKGAMRYAMYGHDAGADIENYREANRDVWEDRLALTPDQRLQLVAYLQITNSDRNRYYDYDYYLDNCSTRVRDALDDVLGGAVRRALAGREAGVSWRWQARRIVRQSPAAYAGMELALGSPADEPMTAWEETFLPLRLRDYLLDVTVRGEDGDEVPLLQDGRRLVTAARAPRPQAPPSWTWAFLLGGLAVSSVLVGLARWARGGSTPGRLALGAALALWATVAGLAGALLLGAWLFTDHTFWYANENLLQANPASLLLAAAALLALLPGRRARWVRPLAGFVLLLSGAGFVLQVLPGLDQVNGEIIAAFLPVHLTVFVVARDLERRPPSGPAADPATS